MKCLYPVKKNRVLKGTRFIYSHACGNCMPCRITNRQQKTLRILLEAQCHEQNIFTTLTYNDEKLPYVISPDGVPVPTLTKRDIPLFLKRLRKRVSPIKIRFYECGEYGERTSRPHYHLVIFGLSIDYHEIIQLCWPEGFTKTDELTKERASYIARYTTKKLTSTTAFEDGRHPEFGSMSTCPGLGRHFNKTIRQAFKDRQIMFISEKGVAPTAIRINGSILPMDSYLKEHLLMVGEEDYAKAIRLHTIEMSKILYANEEEDEKLLLSSQRKAQRIFNKKGQL